MAILRQLAHLVGKPKPTKKLTQSLSLTKRERYGRRQDSKKNEKEKNTLKKDMQKLDL